MEMLELYRAGERVARYALGARTLEIGRAWSCDVAVEDPELAERHFLLLRRRGTVIAFDVSSGRRQRVVEYPLPLDRAVPLGRHHELRRVVFHRSSSVEPAMRAAFSWQSCRCILGALGTLTCA